MHIAARAVTGALATLVLFALLAGPATANRSLEFRGVERGLQLSGTVTLNGTELTAETRIVCPVTLLNTLTRIIPKTASTSFGRVTGMAVNRTSCTVGGLVGRLEDVTPLIESGRAGRGTENGRGTLTWDLSGAAARLWLAIYDSFSGTLPEISGISFHIEGSQLQVRASIFTCLFAGSLFARMNITRKAVTSVEAVLATTRLARISGTFCPIATATIAGTFTPSPAMTIELDAALPMIVSVGDSYISGEGGRWAGNTAKRGEEARMDRWGAEAYFDGARREIIPGCHRSLAAEIHIGGVDSRNLACSGARVRSVEAGGVFKPGLDFEVIGANRGQAQLLEDLAREHRTEIKLVAISIGGNDFGFGRVAEECVSRYVRAGGACSTEAAITRLFERAALATNKTTIQRGIENVREAMRRAGYEDTAYTILVQNYMAPIPAAAAENRYPERSLREEEAGSEEVQEEVIAGKKRQWKGGCGFYDADARWAVETALPEINRTVAEAAEATRFRNIVRLDLASVFNGRRLCERTVGLYEELGLESWRAANAIDRTEWITQIHINERWHPNFRMVESLHPNHWGQMGLRNCLRRAYNAGVPRGGRCVIERAGEAGGEPRMELR